MDLLQYNIELSFFHKIYEIPIIIYVSIQSSIFVCSHWQVLHTHLWMSWGRSLVSFDILYLFLWSFLLILLFLSEVLLSLYYMSFSFCIFIVHIIILFGFEYHYVIICILKYVSSNLPFAFRIVILVPSYHLCLINYLHFNRR